MLRGVSLIRLFPASLRPKLRPGQADTRRPSSSPENKVYRRLKKFGALSGFCFMLHAYLDLHQSIGIGYGGGETRRKRERNENGGEGVDGGSRFGTVARPTSAVGRAAVHMHHLHSLFLV